MSEESPVRGELLYPAVTATVIDDVVLVVLFSGDDAVIIRVPKKEAGNWASHLEWMVTEAVTQ